MKDILKKIVVSILTWEAKRVLSKYQPKIVAVTGSVGKTGTKDAVYTLLSSVAFARKSEKSFNSEFGVPLTILGLPTAWSSPLGWIENMFEGLHLLLKTKAQYPEWLVLEVGADHPGDIKKLAWLAPHVVILTRFPDVPVHVEHFASPAEVIAEKRELKKALRSSGTLVINHDDPAMHDEPLSDGQHRVSYGFSEGSVVRGTNYRIEYVEGRPVGVACDVSFQNEQLRLALSGTVGEQHLYALLAAIAVGVAEGVSFQKAVTALAPHATPAGRMRLLEGRGGATLLDDSYNASPVAVHAGLAAVRSMAATGKKVVVLGDMMELGEYSVDAHRKVAEDVALTANVFVSVGVRMLAAAEVVRAQPGICTHIQACRDSGEAAQYLKTVVGEGDLVYVKGSQSTRMERVTEALLKDPASAPMVLVRQDRAWKER